MMTYRWILIMNHSIYTTISVVLHLKMIQTTTIQTTTIQTTTKLLKTLQPMRMGNH